MVPFVALDRRNAAHAEAFAATAAAVVRGGSLLLGDHTAAFEHEFAAWCAARHAVAVSSGAAALQLALRAVGVLPGDEVIVPAFTAVPTWSAVVALGAVPVPVDVRANTATLDTALVEQARTTRTKAVVVVHLYGLETPLPVTDLPVVEDAAQAHGAIGDHARSAAVAYSFYPTKNLGGVGDGGAVVTSDPAIAATVRALRTHAAGEGYVHEHASQNFRMSEIEAAWLRLVLPTVHAGNTRRAAIATHYRNAAPGLVWQAAAGRHAHHLCVARVPDRDAARSRLATAGVQTAVHYPLAMTQQPAYCGFARGPVPHAERWAAECLSVPCHPHLTDDEVATVADALARLAS